MAAHNQINFFQQVQHLLPIPDPSLLNQPWVNVPLPQGFVKNEPEPLNLSRPRPLITKDSYYGRRVLLVTCDLQTIEVIAGILIDASPVVIADALRRGDGTALALTRTTKHMMERIFKFMMDRRVPQYKHIDITVEMAYNMNRLGMNTVLKLLLDSFEDGLTFSNIGVVIVKAWRRPEAEEGFKLVHQRALSLCMQYWTQLLHTKIFLCYAVCHGVEFGIFHPEIYNNWFGGPRRCNCRDSKFLEYRNCAELLYRFPEYAQEDQI